MNQPLTISNRGFRGAGCSWVSPFLGLIHTENWICSKQALPIPNTLSKSPLYLLGDFHLSLNVSLFLGTMHVSSCCLSGHTLGFSLF